MSYLLSPFKVLEPYVVAAKLIAKKSKSMVKCDIYLNLVSKYADLLAYLICNIYN